MMGRTKPLNRLERVQDLSEVKSMRTYTPGQFFLHEGKRQKLITVMM